MGNSKIGITFKLNDIFNHNTNISIYLKKYLNNINMGESIEINDYIKNLLFLSNTNVKKLIYNGFKINGEYQTYIFLI